MSKSDFGLLFIKTSIFEEESHVLLTSTMLVVLIKELALKIRGLKPGPADCRFFCRKDC